MAELIVTELLTNLIVTGGVITCSFAMLSELVVLTKLMMELLVNIIPPGGVIKISFLMSELVALAYLPLLIYLIQGNYYDVLVAELMIVTDLMTVADFLLLVTELVTELIL